MVPFLAALALASSVDGQAALRHASALAALGPHPWGSPRGSVAAAYVAAEFRAAGLEEVRLQPFEAGGIRGANVIGVLRAPGPEFVVVSAHHDTAPEAPGAYDDGGGVGVLIETARVMAARPGRARTIVFVSFDGEEAWSTGKGTTTGARAYVQSLGTEGRHLVGALEIEMCGWAGGRPVLHTIPYPDPLRPAHSVVTPAWLVGAALKGAAAAGQPVSVGDPYISWLYQPAVRAARTGLYGDDLAFLQAGLPAVFLSDSSFSAFYPWYHLGADTADKLDPAALARAGTAAVGIVDSLARVSRPPDAQPDWFAAFGHTVQGLGLWLALAATVLPGLSIGLVVRGRFLAARLVQAALLLVLFWFQPVLAVFGFFLANLLSAVVRRTWATVVGLLPLLAVVALVVAASWRGMVSGLWLPAWQLAVLAGALALVFVPAPGGAPPRARGGKGGGKKKGLPKKR